MKFSNIPHAIIRFCREDDGPTAVEYAVMLAFIILVCFASILTLGEKTNEVFGKPQTALNGQGN